MATERQLESSSSSAEDRLADATEGPRGPGSRPRRPRPGGPRHVERVSGASARLQEAAVSTYHRLDMAITQRPLAVRRDLIRIFGEDRLVAGIRAGSPQIARQAAPAAREAGVRLGENTPPVPDALEIIEER